MEGGNVGLVSNIPYFIEPVASVILNSRAKKLRATADWDTFQRRSAPGASHLRAMSGFYDALMDESRASWKSSALPLRDAAREGAGPKDCKLSIALSGGGLRVVAFLSFLETLKKHDIPITAYAGTSAGSLATLFDRIGVDYDTVWECLDAKLLKSLLFAPNVNLTRGLLSGRRVMAFINHVLPEGIRTYKDVPHLYATSVLVNSWSSWEITAPVGGMDLISADPDSFSTFRKVVFSRDFDPDMPIAKGIFSSMCLPIFQSQRFRRREFMAMTVKGDNSEKVLSSDRGWTIDGGYAENYPLNVLLLSGGEANKDPGTHIVINVAVENPNEKKMCEQNLWSKLIHLSPDVSNAEELGKEQGLRMPTPTSSGGPSAGRRAVSSCSTLTR